MQQPQLGDKKKTIGGLQRQQAGNKGPKVTGIRPIQGNEALPTRGETGAQGQGGKTWG